ncbi:MAG: DUF2812 domain-containing protein [Pseudomonadota bacterium]|nr:DUF2812 domain-containing protein [Pseudomonadota bacterium]
MSTATVKRFKWFWPDQDIEQEQWLRAMALQGLHLKSLNLLQFWSFEQGAPADIVYRVDFSNEAIKPAYRQLLEDAGWKEALQFCGWQYWRTQAVNGRAPEIFSDAASKGAKFTRLLGLIVVVSVPSMLLIMSPSKNAGFGQLSWPLLVLTGAALLTNMVSLVRLGARVLRLRREQH